MSDVFSRKKRSQVMAAIRAKNTKPEMIVRRILHAMGYRFRLHVCSLPGRPDIVIPSIRTIVQVKGCFWHGHHCLKGRIPVANRGYWKLKIRGNRLRDERNERRLRLLGWHVRTIWECAIRRSTAPDLLERMQHITRRRSRAVDRPLTLTKSAMEAIDAGLVFLRNRRQAT